MTLNKQKKAYTYNFFDVYIITFLQFLYFVNHVYTKLLHFFISAKNAVGIIYPQHSSINVPSRILLG